MRPRQSLFAALAICVVASVYAAAGSGFSIDKTKTFLGGTFTHGSGTDGIHEDITARAIRRGLPGAPRNLVGLIQAGAENVDVTHHFDAEYHFDSASIATFPRNFERGFAAVHAHLQGAAKLADRNPEFFGPSYTSFRHIAQDLALAMVRLAGHDRCRGCSKTALRLRAAQVSTTLPALLVNDNPDPHFPTNAGSAFAGESFLRTDCGLCGKLWPVNKAYRTIISTVESASKLALVQSTALEAKDPLRARLRGISDALRAYRAFQALGHAFHATQDFFAHSNYVELLAGVAVAQPIPKGTKIPVPQQRTDFSLHGKVMGKGTGTGLAGILGDKFRRLESGASNAIWLGEDDYCLGSLYNPRTSFTVSITPEVTRALGLPRIRFTTPGGKNPRPPKGLNYCHYPTSANPGLNKDEPVDPRQPKASEPSHVNHPFARQAAEDMTAVLWKSFLASVHRPETSPAPGTTPTPKPKPKPPPAKRGTWVLKRTQINPLRAQRPTSFGSTLTVENGHLNWKFSVVPQAEFDVRWKTPPARLAPGAYSFAATVTGKLTGERTEQRYWTVDAILFVQDRWDGSAVGTGQSCTDPIGTAPIGCTAPSKRTGTFKVVVPTPSRPGEAFSFGVGALNCSACAVRYEYVSQ